jgi:hypothetical protein
LVEDAAAVPSDHELLVHDLRLAHELHPTYKKKVKTKMRIKS